MRNEHPVSASPAELTNIDRTADRASLDRKREALREHVIDLRPKLRAGGMLASISAAAEQLADVLLRALEGGQTEETR